MEPLKKEETTTVEVEAQVTGTTTIGKEGLANPTPLWVRKVVRALTWITGIWAVLSINIDLTDFGVSEKAEMLTLKYMAALTLVVSLAARFTGVKPPDLTDKNG